MSKIKLVREFLEFLRSSKKIWLIPILVLFLLFSLVILVSQSQAVAPFIYSLF
ncbi:MAG: hypothetical protein JXR86_05875 [Spirochaetales bacterium]|nr:hypothetical protein [Spirochaetales bacterium]